VVAGAVGLGGRGVSGGSRISRYLDTINTEMKYTMARERNCACLVSSCENKFSFLKIYFNILLIFHIPAYTDTTTTVNSPHPHIYRHNNYSQLTTSL
jgi:hypothetical protein